jgi:hypothetical protein
MTVAAGIATGDEANLRRFKRKILKNIYGPFNINGIWHIRYSQVILYAAYGTPGTVR